MATEDVKTAQISLLTSQHTQLKTLTARLVNEPAFRSAFLDDPGTALQAVGIKSSAPIRLSERDKLLLKLATDANVASIYQSGNIASLRQYVIANYSGLVVPGANKADAAADFDVVIETEVVAVAEVAAVAIAVASAVMNPGVEAAQLGQVAVLNARVAALEARIGMIEQQR